MSTAWFQRKREEATISGGAGVVEVAVSRGGWSVMNARELVAWRLR